MESFAGRKNLWRGCEERTCRLPNSKAGGISLRGDSPARTLTQGRRKGKWLEEKSRDPSEKGEKGKGKLEHSPMLAKRISERTNVGEKGEGKSQIAGNV